MIIGFSPASSSVIFSNLNASKRVIPLPSHCSNQLNFQSNPISFCSNKSCLCGRRRFIESAMTSSLLPLFPSPLAASSDSDSSSSDYQAKLNQFHPPKPDWYEDFYAYVMAYGMKSYEAEIADYKSQIFANLRGKAEKVLEIGIGGGPNLKYYAGDVGMKVFGTDPNRKMEKYAREAALDAGLPPENFEFKQAVGEALPLPDASVDAVVGTLVLCSVKNVDLTLNEVKRVLRPGGLYVFVEHVAAEEGTMLRFIQNVLNPLQQMVSDGCHLTRKTGKNIAEAGFSKVDLNMAYLSKAAFVNPQVYGIAYK